MNRKRIILAALLGVLVICMAYAYIATPRLEKAPPRSESKRARTVATEKTSDHKTGISQDHIDFTFMQIDAQEFPGAERDVFRFGQKRPKATAASTTQPELESAPPVVVDAPLIEDMVPIEIVQQALGQFTFLGFLDKGGEKTVFLSSEGSLFLAKRGEEFGADLEFTVEDISEDLLYVRHVGREGLIEIPLIEQQKLSASVSAPAHLQPTQPVSQPKARVFNPKRRMLRPAAPQGNEEDFPGTIEENGPEGEQDVDSPAEGVDSEGEANGSNQ